MGLVVCISLKKPYGLGEDYIHLTVGKTYDTHIYSDRHYLLTDDNLEEALYLKTCFKPLEDIRKEKLEKLGI